MDKQPYEEAIENFREAVDSFQARWDLQPTMVVVSDQELYDMVDYALESEFVSKEDASEGQLNDGKRMKVMGYPVAKESDLPHERDLLDERIAVTSEVDRVGFLVVMAACYCEDDRPIGGEFLREFGVSSDECMSLMTRLSVILRGFMLSPTDQRTRIMMRGITSKVDPEIYRRVEHAMSMDRILEKMSGMNPDG